MDETPASFSWFTKTTGKYTGHIIELSIISIVLRLLGLVQPFVFQALIDRILPFQREDSLYIVVALLVGVALFQSAFKSVSTYLGGDLVNQLTREFSRRIYEHVLHLPLRTLQRWQVGELFARMGEIETIRRFLTGTISGVVIDIVFSFIYLGALFSISPSLTLIIIVILPTQMAAIAMVGPFLRFVLPAIGMSVFIFAPIEYVAARFGIRWVTWIVTPLVGAGVPWLFQFIAPNRTNFLAGISQLCFLSGVMGVLWTISSLTAAFLQQPPLPDKRLFD
ncbi:ABC transporter transmembrane domain-containing protein [Rhizobium rhizogenes]|uniref:ABC transmembrane type-1 domain-containing protein n=1 Tax=Rhizobium rhizogenes NBRC 13257 TaxID=1220581 RepID=A0AA87U8C4_RHIRH|nr:ABC transporter transmembrane domain-containing protein [Rhizobium rhizogenes]NTG65119.1 hypothetical protein [Rhizobium rhizogenes]NTG71570.1 hypothetical protein [Rhizobium rhizogenes]NTG84469.1 hypothetical protein [Rhizobium rhizogenes]NTH29497.1 hypothetical protein [Rhizobium rhizogenes]NTI00322.1 hypothetical protein [Rhizobium rhizogenes]